jgi:hypothetical protein
MVLNKKGGSMRSILSLVVALAAVSAFANPTTTNTPTTTPVAPTKESCAKETDATAKAKCEAEAAKTAHTSAPVTKKK